MNRFSRVVYVVACAVVLVPLSFVASIAISVSREVRHDPVYEATAQLRYPDPSPSATYESFRIVQNTYATTIMSNPWLADAMDNLNRPRDEISRKLVRLYASPIDKTSIISLHVQALDPVFASDFANTWATTVIKFYGTNAELRPAVIAAAVPPGAPSTPRKLTNITRSAVVGALVGILLSIAIGTISHQLMARWRTTPRTLSATRGGPPKGEG